MFADRQDLSSSAKQPSHAVVSDQIAPNPPVEAVSQSDSKQTPQSKSSKATKDLLRGVIGAGKSQVSEEKKQVTKEPLARHKPGKFDEVPSSDSTAKGKFGRNGVSRAEEKTRPQEASQSSRNVPSPFEPGSLSTENVSSAKMIEPKASRTGWASRYAETSIDKSQDKSQRSEKKQKFGNEAVSTDAPRDLPFDQDGQAFETAQASAAQNGGSSFKQRMQEGLGIGKEKNLLKPLKSKFSNTNKQETIQPIAGDAQATQAGGTPRPSQQADPSTTLDKPTKEWKPYTASKISAISGTRTEASKYKAPYVEDWLSSSPGEAPSRPERPQDELFMGVPDSNPRPSPLMENTLSSKISQSSPFSNSKAKQKSPRDTNVPLSNVKADRPDPLMTSELAEASQSSKPEQSSREYTLVTAGTPVNLSSESSKNRKTPAVRVVSGIIERPREIEIQKPSQTDKAIRPSKREVQSNSNEAEKLDAVPSRARKSNETKDIDSPPDDAAQPLPDPTIKQETEFGHPSRDQGRRTDNNGTRKLPSVNDQWPRPVMADSASVGGDITERPRRIDGKEGLASEDTKSDVSANPTLVEAVVSDKPGLLGRWTGRGKRDKTTERTKQSLADQPPSVTTNTSVKSSLTPGTSGQSFVLHQGPEIGVPADRTEQHARDHTGAPSMPVMETPSGEILASGTTQKAAFSSLANEKGQEKDASSSLFTSSISDSQNAAPAPLFVGGRKPVLPEEAVSKNRGAFVPYSPPAAEKQASAKDRPAERDLLSTTRAEDSNITSPEMPSQEDFFKQMRQSVMFQNADSMKMDIPESTDAATKRKSRRNRNFSISGLQPARQTAAPDMPTLSNLEQPSAVGGGNSIPISDVPQATSASWLEPTSFETSDRREMSGPDTSRDLLSDSSKAQPKQPTQEGWVNTPPPASSLGEQVGVENSSPTHMHVAPSRSPLVAEASPSSLPTRADEVASPQPSSASLPSGTRMGRTVPTEVIQADMPNFSTDERKAPEVLVKPAALAAQDRVAGNEQAGSQMPDLKTQTRSPNEPIFVEQRLEQNFDVNGSPTDFRDPGYKVPIQRAQKSRVTEASRTPLHPAPSSAGIFRRPSFSDDEELGQPMTTHNMPHSEDQSDPKIQSFFDGLFKSNNNEDLALGLDSTHSTKGKNTDENQAGTLANDESSKGLSGLPQAQTFGADVDAPALKGTSLPTPSPVPRGKKAARVESVSSETDLHPSSNTLGQTQEVRQDPSVIRAPMTPNESATKFVGPSNVPRGLSTPKRPEISDPLVYGNSTEMSSPNSFDVPMLVVEDVSAHPMSRVEGPPTHSKSPSNFGEVGPRWEDSKIDDSAITPRIDHGTPGSFATEYGEEEKQASQQASDSIKDKDPRPTIATAYAASETNFSDFVKDRTTSPGKPESLVENTHVSDEYISSEKNRNIQSDVGSTEVLPQKSPVLTVPEERQDRSYSSTESADYLEQRTAPTSLNPSFISREDPIGLESQGSSWAYGAGEENDAARPSKSYVESENLGSNGHQDHIKSSHLPRSGVELINSPQESDPDLSDHILSLYDGHDSIAPDHQPASGFSQSATPLPEAHAPWPGMESAHTKSLSDLHSSTTEHRDSISSIGAGPVESPKMSALPSDTNGFYAPVRPESRLSTLEPVDGSMSPSITPAHDSSNTINGPTENVGQERPKAAGFKDKFRMLFSKTNSSEPRHESHTQPGAVPAVDENPQSPEPSNNLADLHGDNHISTDYASPLIDSRLDETGDRRDAEPLEGANLISPRSQDNVDLGSSSIQTMVEGHLVHNAMSPEPHGNYAAQLNEREEGASHLPSPHSTGPTPAMKATEQWDDPLTSHHLKDGNMSAESDRHSLPNSPIRANDDDGHFPRQNDHHMQNTDEFDTQDFTTPRDGKYVGVTPRPDSHFPDATYDSTSLDGTPDLQDTRHNWSPEPEEGQDMFNGLGERSHAFDTDTPKTESIRETHIANEEPQMSPVNTAHYASNDTSRDISVPEQEATQVFGAHLSEPDVSSPGFEHNDLQSSQSHMPQETTQWVNNDLDGTHDRYEGSPSSEHMDDEPAILVDMNDSPEIRSPQGQQWSDAPMQTGSFSPAFEDGNHDRVGARSYVEPQFDADAATTYSGNHDVPDNHFAAEYGNAQDEFDDQANDRFRVEDYEDKNQDLGHLGASGSSFGNDNVHDDFDTFSGDQSPAYEFSGKHEDSDDMEPERHSVDHHLGGHEGSFDHTENDRLPANDDFSAHSETFEDRRMDDYRADQQDHEGGLDHFEDDKLPADDFNDRPQTFHSPKMDGFPADRQDHEGGFDSFENETSSSDNFSGRPESFDDGPRMDGYPADHQSYAGGFDDFQEDRLPAEDFNNHPEPFDSPRMETYPVDDFPHNDDGFADHHGPASDGYQDDVGGVGEFPMDHYPTDGPSSPGGGFEDSGVDHYPVDDFERNSGVFGGADIDRPPVDDFAYDTAGPNNSVFDNYDADYQDGDHQRDSEPMGEGMSSYEPDHDASYSPGGLDGFNPGHEDVSYGGAPLSDYGGEQGMGYEQEPGFDHEPDFDQEPAFDQELAFDHQSGFGQEPAFDQEPEFDQGPEPMEGGSFHEDYREGSPLEDGPFGNDDFAGGQPEFDDHGDGMNFNDNMEDNFDEMRGDEFDNQDYGADVDHGLDGGVDHFYGEPSWEGDDEPESFHEGGFGDEGEPPFDGDWEEDQMDGDRGLDEPGEHPMDAGEDFPIEGGEEYPMDGGEGFPVDDGGNYPMDGGEDYPMDRGEDFPIGSEAEEYPLGGGEAYFPDAMVDGDPPMGGEAEEYYMGGEGMQSPDLVDGGDFPMGGEADDYMMGGDGEVDYPMETMGEGDEFPMEGHDELPIDEMYGEGERSMEPMENDEFPMGDGEASSVIDGEEYPMDQEDGFPMEAEDFEGSDRGIEDFEADDQFENDMSDQGSMPDEEQGSQFGDGSVEARSLIDEETGSQIADEDGGSIVSEPFDEEPAGDPNAEAEDLAPSEVEDREIEDDAMSLLGEEDVDGEEQDMDDLYEADVPSIPASPTGTDHGRDLASPVPNSDQDDAGQDEEDDIFDDLDVQEDPADLENADPVRLSCLYMQDVGLMSSPSSPPMPQASDAAAQNEAEEEEEELPREPVRFSALYRQSLDWSEALDSSMWENDDEALPEEDEEQDIAAPVLEAVPESAKRQENLESLQMLEVDQEPLTPVAASPLSPRPLETPPPDYEHNNDMATQQLVEEPEELYKGANENGPPQYAVSPRPQPTPPPDQDQASVNNDGQDDRRDSRGPQTFDEMNLPRRVISPPNTGDDDDLGGSSQASTASNLPMRNSRRSISQRFSGWWTGSGSSAQVPARPPPLPSPYDSRYGEPRSPV